MLPMHLIVPAAAKVRAEFENAPVDGGELRKLAQDVWAIEGPLNLITGLGIRRERRRS